MAEMLAKHTVELLRLEEECRALARTIAYLQEELPNAMKGNAADEAYRLLDSWQNQLHQCAAAMDSQRQLLVQEQRRRQALGDPVS